MGKLRFYSEEEIEDIIDLYKNKNFSLEKISQKYGAGRGSIKRILIENSIHIKNAKDLYEKKIPLNVQEKVIYNYTQLGMGLIPSGKEFGLSQYLVKKILKENNIYIRSYTESKDNLRKYSCDDDYFKNQTSNMAYILGLLASDGNVAKKENQINICLNEEDYEILEKIRKEIKSTRPIKVYSRNNGATQSKLVVFSSTMKKDLSHYSIVPNKTFILQPPELLKKEYYIDYIRGYFDGDGSVYINSNGIPGVNIGGASKEMIEWIRKVLAEQYGIICKKIDSSQKLSEKRNYNRIFYYGENIVKLYKIFYKNDSLYMKRKKDIFKTILMNNYPRDYESLVLKD